MFIQIMDSERNTLLAQTTKKTEQEVNIWLIANGFLKSTKHLWLHSSRNHIVRIIDDDIPYFVSYDGGEKQPLPELWNIKELTFVAKCQGYSTYTVSTNKFNVLTINL